MIIKLMKTTDARIRNSVVPAGTGTFVEVSGMGNERITLMCGNDLTGVRKAVAYTDGAGEVVRLAGNL